MGSTSEAYFIRIVQNYENAEMIAEKGGDNGCGR